MLEVGEIYFAIQFMKLVIVVFILQIDLGVS
jgi:hypothetical protein